MGPCLSPGPEGVGSAPDPSGNSPVPGSSRDALRELLFHSIHLVAKLQRATRCPSPGGK